MKRDMDLARQILLDIEEAPQLNGLGFAEVTIEGKSKDEVSYHVMLLHEAGLIEAQDLSSHSGCDWRPKRLTWSGHEFLDTYRADTVWNKSKQFAREKGLALSFELLKQIAPHLLKSVLGIS